MTSGIYAIVNLVNKKVYIGQSKDTHHRLIGHKCLLNKNKHGNSHLQRAINKYGLDNFEFKTIVFCEENLLDEYEKNLISLLNTTDDKYGYNIENGGNAKKVVSLETREKLRQANLGKKQSEEAKLKKSIAAKKNGNRPPLFTGKKHTEEWKLQLSERNRQRAILRKTS